MKTLTKVLLAASLLSVTMKTVAKINVFLSFMLCMLLFGFYILSMAFLGAVKIKNADSETIKKYNERIIHFKNLNKCN
jgi:hypothetical protein